MSSQADRLEDHAAFAARCRDLLDVDPDPAASAGLARRLLAVRAPLPPRCTSKALDPGSVMEANGAYGDGVIDIEELGRARAGPRGRSGELRSFDEALL